MRVDCMNVYSCCVGQPLKVVNLLALYGRCFFSEAVVVGFFKGVKFVDECVEVGAVE